MLDNRCHQSFSPVLTGSNLIDGRWIPLPFDPHLLRLDRRGRVLVNAARADARRPFWTRLTRAQLERLGLRVSSFV